MALSVPERALSVPERALSVPERALRHECETSSVEGSREGRPGVLARQSTPKAPEKDAQASCELLQPSLLDSRTTQIYLHEESIDGAVGVATIDEVFYANLRIKGSRILSPVKGVDVCIDEAVWKTVVGFHPAGIKPHPAGIKFHPADMTLVAGLKRDELLCAFVIAWVLLPRGGNHAQLTSANDEHVPVFEEVKPIGVDKSKYCFKPQSKFEKFVVEQFKKQDVKLSMLQKSFSVLHRKLDYALKINAFGGTSEDNFVNEENKTNEGFIEISDLE
ncbi:hypothetical protein LR48_Vigan272s004300 [Vigna angularis]|uniref:Uncharacterized protein n=1 Tax=Phaseolus angularis TaxID=3914 RepID=A0A0L9T789_PHAAN|nr:hypothetical protein LR48_Vigan272s004300 [Vigna angularis]